MSRKIIAAVLTAALALSPVFVAPISATDGQEVETSASSWRYQDGDIIIDEGLDAMEADSDMEVFEDYNAQMGSNSDEEQIPAAEQTGAAAEEQEQTGEPDQVIDEPLVEPAEEQSDQTAEELSEQPAEDQSGQQTEEQPGQTVQEQEPVEEAEPETTLEAQSVEDSQDVQAPGTQLQAEEQAPAQAEQPAAEPRMTAMSATTRDRYWTWSSGKYKRGPGYLKGIDVSYWQGTINWKKVKAAGVDFAILRCGYGPNTTAKDDSKFAANVKGCRENGIPYGVYLYSYADSVSKAKDEADHAIRLLKANKCSLQYPVYYDLEDRKVSRAGAATICKMANAFCSKLKNSGYPSGVYANLNWWNNKLGSFNGYDKWVAQWSSSCTYKKAYSIWQCTSSTTISGISGRVDANLLMCKQSSMKAYMKTGKPVEPEVTYSLKTIDGKQYAVREDGTIAKNAFLKIGAYTYGFGEDGVKITDRKYWINCKAYTFDSEGRAYINKSKTKKKTPYYAKAGSGKKGTLKKGKKFYVLRTSGKWSQMANGYWVKTKNIKKIARYPSVKPLVKVKYKAKLKKKTISRSGPSKKYIKKKTFKKNSKVTVIGTYGSWSKISTGQWIPISRLKK